MFYGSSPPSPSGSGIAFSQHRNLQNWFFVIRVKSRPKCIQRQGTDIQGTDIQLRNAIESDRHHQTPHFRIRSPSFGFLVFVVSILLLMMIRHGGKCKQQTKLYNHPTLACSSVSCCWCCGGVGAVLVLVERSAMLF